MINNVPRWVNTKSTRSVQIHLIDRRHDWSIFHEEIPLSIERPSLRKALLRHFPTDISPTDISPTITIKTTVPHYNIITWDCVCARFWLGLLGYVRLSSSAKLWGKCQNGGTVVCLWNWGNVVGGTVSGGNDVVSGKPVLKIQYEQRWQMT